MPTIMVRVKHQGKYYGPVRALLDSGAQPNLIQHNIVNTYCLPTYSISRKVLGVDGNPVKINKQISLEIVPWFDSDASIEDVFWILPKEAKWTPVTPQIDLQPIAGQHEFPLADPTYWKQASFSILLGVKFFARIITHSVPRGIDGLMTVETAFGIILFGVYPLNTEREQVDSMQVARCVELENVDNIIKRLWEMSEQGRAIDRTPEEQAVEDNFTNTTWRDEEGRFVVTIPLKPGIQEIGDSRAIALRRFMYLEKKFTREPVIKEKYIEFMREYASLGHMVKVTHDPLPGKPVYYIPHHCVTKKFRVVFDCSCRTDKGISLNEVQQLGEKLQRDLFDIVMRYRRHRIAFSSDIKMMFRQVRIAQQQWDLQRIFWRESPRDKLEEYWLTVVTYGMTASAYNAVRALIQCGRDASKEFPDVNNIIANDFYMDDCVSGCDSEEEALHLITRLDRVLRTAGFELCKWKSNSQWLMSKFGTARERALTFDSKEQAAVLGLQWLVEEDQFTFVVKTTEIAGKVTKRKVLSCMAQLYDPNGYIAPVIILGKIFIQDMWRLSLDWDQEVTSEMKARWLALWQGIQHLERFRIDRWLGTGKGEKIQIHGFSDASQIAYGAVVYVRVEKSNGEIMSKLVVSKTRVAPLKTITIPRLELAAAELLGRLIVDLCKAMEWQGVEYTLWTDSMVTLHWLQKFPRDMKTYVANRVSSIQTNTDIKQWRHVGTKENPADLLSRGMSSEELVNSQLWLHGPHWLCLPKSKWPVNPIVKQVSEIAKGEMNVCIVTTRKVHLGIWVPEEQEIVQIEKYASNLNKAVSIMGYVFHYMHRLQAEAKLTKRDKRKRHLERGMVTPSTLTTEERGKALKYFIKQAQNEVYSKDITALRSKHELPEHSKIESLKPVFDNEGILCVGGRLDRASGEYETRHPAIIPNGTRLAWLIIDNTHQLTKHGGTQIMMQVIRQRYWIPKMRNELRNYIHKCVTCARYNYRLEQQLMSELPADRVQAGKPFLTTGVDYAGPFMLKVLDRQGRKLAIRKVWVAIFVCLKTRAVHIDLVGDLTSVSFLACYYRFISRRGHCQRMYSDNGTSFVGAAREIKQAWKEWQENELFSKLCQRGTDWIFMIPAAPHQGGIYEAAVKSMKYHLKRVIGQQILEYEQFLTLLLGIEGILNSRPIHPLSDDPADLQALTPGHFLIGEPIVLPPPFLMAEEAKTKGARLYRQRQAMFKDFWKRWREEYLVTLQERKKWRRVRKGFKVGQLVLIKSENFPPAQWALGRICELIRSKDGIVRSVGLKTETGQLMRPVQKICILPVEASQSELND